MRRTRIKICCISSPEEAALAIREGADALGLVGPMPSGPGVIDDQLISAIV
ncbi:MAG: phosphoribosylanthranilate isomerase, partial [Pseudomonadota bacterium]